MARKSRVVQALILAEDILLFFNDYFKSTSWVYHDTGIPKVKVQKSVWYLVEKNILNKDLSFKKKPKTIYKEITKPWSGYWRMVIYDIPEEKSGLRDKLCYHLDELGFKRLQRSVWLSPFTSSWIVKKIEGIINNPELLFVIKSKFTKEKTNYLVDNLWPIEEWKLKCENFITELKEKKKLTLDDQTRFWDLVAEHPRVPLDLLPGSWPLRKVAKIFCHHVKH